VIHCKFVIYYIRSGTDEEYTEREELLQDVLDLFNDRDHIKKALKMQKKAASAVTDIRKRAMETLKGKIKLCN
jgi:GTP1/Obg family GTP-binding protein